MTVTPQQYKDAMALIKLFKSQQDIPKPLDEPDYKLLKEATLKYIEMLQKGVIGGDDFKQEIFVTAMEAVFGDNVWDWVQDNIKHEKK